MGKKGFKERFAKPWVKGATFSFAISLVMLLLNLIANGMTTVRLPDSVGGPIRWILLLAAVPWIGGILLSWIDKKINF